MKKIFFAFTLIAGLSFVGFAQKTEKLLKSNKWFATGGFDGKNIVLSKTQPTKYDWDAKFAEQGVMNYCSFAKSAVLNAQGVEVKEGTYYCDPSYTYEVKGDLLYVKYPLVDFCFKVKKSSNGDLELVYTTNEAAANGNPSK